MPSITTMSIRDARALAVSAAYPPPVEDPRGSTVTGVLRHLGCVQLDAIAVLARAHQLTIASRLDGATTRGATTRGATTRGATTRGVDDALWLGEQAVAFEYPAHAAALVAVADWPLWAFRRRATRNRPEYPDPVTRDRILTRVAHDGPLPMTALREPGEAGGGWDWGPTKTAVQFLTWSGELVCTRRDLRDHRLFDLPDRQIPAPYLTDELDDHTCLRRLLDRAGRALGVASVDDLADYLRIRPATARAVLPDTELTEVGVDGWRGTAWLSTQAATAQAKPDDAVFIGPFDNLIWHRRRVSRLFGFDHVLEAYKPAAKRRHGYYVCPLRCGHELIGRADLARAGNTLVVVRASLTAATEDGIHAFHAACTDLADRIGLDDIQTPPQALR